jgi:hypothetical protein
MNPRLAIHYHKWPGVVCMNCGAEIIAMTNHPETLYPLAGLVNAGCLGCDQSYTVLTTVQGQYLAHYTAQPFEIYTMPCELVAKRSGIQRKNIKQIRKERKWRDRAEAGQKTMF